MSLFVIADLHLAQTMNKPMDIFGKRWENHTQRIYENWQNTVSDKDTVVIAGDVSWGMRIEEAEADFRFLESLPGHKIVLKGNHDYWWQTMKKLTEFRFKTRELGDKRDLLYRTYTKIEAEYQSVRDRRDKLIAFLWDEYELTYTEALRRATTKVTAENRSEAVSAQAKYKNQIRALGTVNVGAIEEYKEVSERYEYISVVDVTPSAS